MLHTVKNDVQFLGHFPFTAMSSTRLFFFFFLNFEETAIGRALLEGL